MKIYAPRLKKSQIPCRKCGNSYSVALLRCPVCYPVDNISALRSFLQDEIERISARPFSSDTVREYQEALDSLLAFEQTEAGKNFAQENFGKLQPIQIYFLYKKILSPS